MNNKYVLITGGTGGIGKQTATGLARLGAHVIINGRDPARGEQAVREIQRATGNPHVELLLADMSMQSDIHQLAMTYKKRYPSLDVLINNAGLIPSQRQFTAEGIETSFAVNVIGPYLLTTLLLDLLKASQPARVINLAGGLPIGGIDLGNLQSEKKFSQFNAYSHTKRAMLALSLAFAKRLARSGVTVNLAYPGRAETPMTQALEVPTIFKIIGLVTERFVEKGEQTVIKAARCSIYLASSPEVEGVTGRFFNPDTKPGRWNKAAQNPAIQQQLWAMMEQLTVGARQLVQA